MRMFPIIPVWIMVAICTVLVFIIFKYNKKNIIQLILILLVFIINLRIMIPSDKSQSLSNNLDVLFVIDNTISMLAEDYDGTKTRLSAVKNDCKYIIERLNGARFSIITFNNTSKIVTPYTRDNNITFEAIDIIKPISELYAKGSSLNTPIDTMLTSLESAQKKDNRIRILFYISDGEITDESNLESYKEFSKYIDNGAVLGYGTKKGGYMKDNSKYAKAGDYVMYYYDTKYEKAISKIDEDNLKNIANDISIDYIKMNKQSNINDKLEKIQKLINNDIESDDKSTYKDTYYILLVPTLFLLIIYFNNFRRRKI